MEGHAFICRNHSCTVYAYSYYAVYFSIVQIHYTQVNLRTRGANIMCHFNTEVLQQALRGNSDKSLCCIARRYLTPPHSVLLIDECA